jgi:hypothetical protein
MLCLTRISVAVVEIWGEAFPFGEILVEISMGGMVWNARELFYGLATLMNGTSDLSVGVCMLGLTRTAVVVVEMDGELSPHSVICAIFESGGGGTGNSFVRTHGTFL